MTVRRYTSPEAFKQALEQRLRAASSRGGDPVLAGELAAVWDPVAWRWNAT